MHSQPIANRLLHSQKRPVLAPLPKMSWISLKGGLVTHLGVPQCSNTASKSGHYRLQRILDPSPWSWSSFSADRGFVNLSCVSLFVLDIHGQYLVISRPAPISVLRSLPSLLLHFSPTWCSPLKCVLKSNTYVACVQQKKAICFPILGFCRSLARYRPRSRLDLRHC